MAKIVDNTILDAALNQLMDNVTDVYVCSTQPTTHAEADTTYMLAEQLTLGTDFSDVVPADGLTSGRRVSIPEVYIALVSNNGTANFIVLTDGTNILYITECTAQVLADTNPLTIPTWDVELRDPA